MIHDGTGLINSYEQMGEVGRPSMELKTRISVFENLGQI